jgi:hypothetical protein
MKTRIPNADRRRPEFWSIDAGTAAAARLEIPADALRERTFEISVTLTVRAHETAKAPWHELRIYADGELQWSRRIPTQPAAEFDGLDFRFRRHIGVGRSLRLQVDAGGDQVRRMRLLVEAEEV